MFEQIGRYFLGLAELTRDPSEVQASIDNYHNGKLSVTVYHGSRGPLNNTTINTGVRVRPETLGINQVGSDDGMTVEDYMALHTRTKVLLHSRIVGVSTEADADEHMYMTNDTDLRSTFL